jgi:hypothetical protein
LEAADAYPGGLPAAAAAGLVAAGGDGVEGGEVVAGEGGFDEDFEKGFARGLGVHGFVRLVFGRIIARSAGERR